MENLFKVLAIIIMPFMTSASIEVFPVIKEKRQSSSIWDYIFVCQVVGSTLQWEANSYSLGGFTPGENASVRSSTIGMLAYSAVLLQEIQESDRNTILTSVLIISTSSELLQVTCFNGTHSSTSTGTSLLQSLNRTMADSSNNITLQHLFSEVIVQGINAPETHAFLCRVESNNQMWTINNGRLYGFSEVNNTGDVLLSRSSAKPIAEELAFLHAKRPIVTFLLVTGNFNNVSCMSNGQTATLLAGDTTASATQHPSPTLAYNNVSLIPRVDDESSSYKHTTLVEVTIKAMHNNNFTGIVVGCVIAAFAALVVITIILALGVRFYRKRIASMRSQKVTLQE